MTSQSSTIDPHHTPWASSTSSSPPTQDPIPHRQSQNLTLFNLPLRIRHQIYSHVFHPSAPDELFPDDWTYPSAPTTTQLNLLCASRYVYSEASTALYRTVHLGSHAPSALKYLHFLGASRIQHIRYLTLCYQCLQYCGTQAGRDAELDWTPAFELLQCSAGARVEFVRVGFEPCGVDWWPDAFATDTCGLRGRPEHEGFWWGLGGMTALREVEFVNPVPEYYVYRLVREYGFRMHGRVVRDWRGAGPCCTEFVGKLVKADVLDRPAEGVSNLTEAGGDDAEGIGESCSGKRLTQTSTNRRVSFLQLPFDIRQAVYNLACGEWIDKAYWPERPKRWITGVDLLCTCKQIAREALPSVYRTFRPSGCGVLEELDRMGTKIAYMRRLELLFTCFCPHALESTDVSPGGTIFSKEGVFRGNMWYPEKDVVQRYIDMWTQAMAQIRRQKKIKDVQLTFASCCRRHCHRVPQADSGQGTTQAVPTPWSPCLALESHFVDLVAQFQRLHKLSLAGDVPPSLAVRMSGSGLRIRWMSRAMGEFMRLAEQDRSARESTGTEPPPGLLWEMPKASLFPSYQSPVPAMHFVLVNEHCASGSWDRFVDQGDGTQLSAGKQTPAMELLDNTWQNVRDMLDYDNLETDDSWIPADGGW